MNLYISGPMTGKRKHNHPAFNKAAKVLRKKGYKVVSPAELDKDITVKLTWTQCLRRDIKYLVDCQGVATLPGCDDSRGALLEIYIAKALDMPVKEVRKW